jgi:hypothetical protein
MQRIGGDNVLIVDPGDHDMATAARQRSCSPPSAPASA